VYGGVRSQSAVDSSLCISRAVSHSVNVTVILANYAYGEQVLVLFLYACFNNGCWRRKRPSVCVQYEGACISFEVDMPHIRFTLSIMFCLSQLKKTMNKC
jgi:hypothetical protein